MIAALRHIPSDRLFRWLFVLLFWSIWIFSPFLTSGEEHAAFVRYWTRILPITLTNIPLFFLNSEWLIPKILHKRGVGWYLLALVSLAAGFIVLQQAMSAYLRPCHFAVEFKNTFPALFSIAVSTGFGLLSDMVSQEKNRERERRERLQSELSFLRSQISPHFIFNTLNSIVYLIRSKNDLAEPVTIKLSELMRYMLYESQGDQIPLQKEVEYLDNYIELQRVRFGEDVAINFRREGTVGSQQIEPMLLIPFVENAFKHGVGMLKAPYIRVELTVSDDALDFTVTNQIADPSPNPDPHAGIGLRNVTRRLELLYPDRHRLNTTADNGVFRAHLFLQFHEENGKW